MDEPVKPQHDQSKTNVKNETYVAPVDSSPQSTLHRPISRRTGTWIVVVASLLVALLILGLIGTSIAAKYARNSNIYGDNNSSMMNGQGRWRSNMPTVYVQRDPSIDTNTVQMTGVVSAVSGDTITLIGNGTSTAVKTNDSTTYNTVAKKVSVNDSVIVSGVSSGGTFTANTVSIVNR